MLNLNFHHLLYFRSVVKEGSVMKASKALHLSQPAISAQIKTLENILGEKLFRKEGRHLVPTEIGHLIYRYADEIFNLGQELIESLKGKPSGRPLKLRVGISDALPKKIVFEILKPTILMKEKIQLICHENRVDRLLASLSLHELDLVLSDAPLQAQQKIRGYSHLLGTSEIALVGSANLTRQYQKNFPHSLKEASFLLPFEDSSLRRSIDEWFKKIQIKPIIQGEFEDTALLKTFGREGIGLFFVPQVILKEIEKDYKVQCLAFIPEIKESFYALSIERKIEHPAFQVMNHFAKTKLFKKTNTSS